MFQSALGVALDTFVETRLVAEPGVGTVAEFVDKGLDQLGFFGPAKKPEIGTVDFDLEFSPVLPRFTILDLIVMVDAFRSVVHRDRAYLCHHVERETGQRGQPCYVLIDLLLP